MPIPRPRPGPAPRSQPDEQYELLRWVAELYYLQQQGQADIANLIGASVSKVSRLLAEARRQGIVTIHVAASRVGDSPFERELAERLGLQAVYVAPARVTDASVASRAAALMAARMLPRLLPLNGLVGLSGGYTVAQLAHSLEPMPGLDLTIVPLQGNWVEGGVHVHNDQVCRDAAHSLQARALSLPAPMLFDRPDTRDALLRDRSLRPVTSRWSELDVAVVGVGPAPTLEGVDYLSVMGQLPDEVRSDLEEHGVVGDLCAHMFDAGGHFVEHEVSQRTLSISIDELRRVPRVVAVAGGLTKAISLLGAVRTGIPKVLIMDQLAAESLSALIDGNAEGAGEAARNNHYPAGAGGYQRS